MRIILCANEGGCAPPNPVVLKPPMLPIKRKHHVITMFAGRECCADDNVCKWGGLRPPQPPRCFFLPSMTAIKRKHHVIAMFAMGECCAKHFLQMGSCASPSPRCFNMSSPGLQRGKVVRHTLFAPDIFRVCRSPSSQCEQRMDFKNSCYRLSDGDSF